MGLVVKNPPAGEGRCKRCGFDPWVGKIPWRRACQPTPVFLPSEFHGQRSLAGYSPWGGKGSDTTEPLSTYAATRKGRVSTRQGVRVGTSGMEHKQDWWLSSNPRMKKKKKYIPQSLLTLQTAAAAGFMRGREEMFTPIPPLLPFHPPNNHSPKITPLAFSERGAGGVPSALTQRHFVPGRER